MSRPRIRQRGTSDALRLDINESLDTSNAQDAPNSSSQPHPNSRQQPSVSRHRAVSSLQTPSSSKSTTPQQNRHNRSRSSAYLSPGVLSQGFHFDTADQDSRQPSDEEMTPVEKTNAAHTTSFQTIVPTWTNMPAKPQLAILCLSRFVDFFQMASLQTYMVHQLKSFDPSLPDSIISHQAGVLQGAFTAAQIVTSILWGRLADRPAVGRKLVLNIGLVGTGVSMLGVGFSTTYTQAVVWRVLGGAINGTVGSARTMVAETVDKRWHPRAFLLLPAAFNIANVAGPILGGMLVEPVVSFPTLFGENSTFGGVGGVAWMRDYPYALANLLSTILLFGEAVLVTFFLKETLRGYKGFNWSELSVAGFFGTAASAIKGVKLTSMRTMAESKSLKQGLLSGREDADVELDQLAPTDAEVQADEKGQTRRPPPQLPFRRIWTSNVLWTLLSVAIFDFHMGAFNNLWIMFLSTAREFVPGQDAPSSTKRSLLDPEDYHRLRYRAASAIKFSGGLAFPPPTIGFAMATLGFIGVALQFLLYPWANGKFGLMRCFRWSLFLFPLAYILVPYISLLPSTTAYPEPAAGFWVWSGIAVVLTLQVAARTFALPASIILVNNSSPHPSVLATIHGLGQADSATFRTFGPILAGGWYGTWLERGVVGMAWWMVAGISAIGCFASFYVRNGSGHEIFLEGEEEGDTAPGGGGGIRRRDSVAGPSGST